jgi:hypothetical protein
MRARVQRNITEIDVKNMNDVNAQAVGPAAIARRVVAGAVDACARSPGIDVRKASRHAQGHAIGDERSEQDRSPMSKPRPPSKRKRS